tara:strand:- start:290 stop:490 length:201 start_codon:yes stop_codon:yes gene_type:complete
MQIHTSSTVHAALSQKETEIIACALGNYESIVQADRERLRSVLEGGFRDAALRCQGNNDHSFREEA